MASPLPASRIEIDLAAYRANLRAFQAHVGQGVLVMPVVKANAYGHGAVEIGRAAVAAGIRALAVNRVAEGVALRQAGIDVPLLVMGYVGADEMPAVITHRLTPTLTEMEGVAALAALAGSDPYPVHVKVDTGMGRLGLLPHEALAFLRQVAGYPNLALEGLYTHFAVADSPAPDDQAYTRRQLATFLEVLTAAETAGLRFRYRHAANSAGALYYRESHLDLVRIGIASYGLRPDAGHATPFALQPVLSVKTRVGRLRTLPSGTSISYGRTYTTTCPTRVALIPIGYGDGVSRALSNRGAVLIGGGRAPIIGRVCMDQFMVDASACPSAALDAEVVFIGRSGGAEISADEVASLEGTINYEVVTRLLERLPRVYVNG